MSRLPPTFDGARCCPPGQRAYAWEGLIWMDWWHMADDEHASRTNAPCTCTNACACTVRVKIKSTVPWSWGAPRRSRWRDRG